MMLTGALSIIIDAKNERRIERIHESEKIMREMRRKKRAS
jgi:hypothetical protein